MKKLLLISVLLCWFIFAGCSQQRWLSQDELFSKKQECAKYKNSIQDEINEEKKRLEKLEVSYDGSIEEIFYNSKENSCFAVLNEQTLYKNWNQIINSTIKDLLTNKTVAHYQDWQEDATNAVYYFKKLKELKWE